MNQMVPELIQGLPDYVLGHNNRQILAGTDIGRRGNMDQAGSE